MKLCDNTPSGPLEEKWTKHKLDAKLVAPAHKRKYEIIVVGTGLAGSSAVASLAEQGYKIKAFCALDSPRRAHSIAAQGGINAAKNYQNDGDSVFRFFYDTMKGGDFRSREANVYRLAEVSANIIDQCVAQGVPFTREYGGYLGTRPYGGTQVSRTFYSKGQTGQQLLLGAYGALSRQIALGKVEMYNRMEMLDVVLVKGKARGVIVRDLVTGKIESHSAHAVILATGGYGNVFHLSTNAMGSNASAIWKAYKKGAFFANPCFVQVHPTCIPVLGRFQSKLTLMSEALRNDGRIWVPKTPNDPRLPSHIPEEDRDYYLEGRYPVFGNLVPRDIASRNAKAICDEGRGVGSSGLAVFLDFKDAVERDGKEIVSQKYGYLFDMYQQITGDDPYKSPMKVYPAVHFTMGGLWVDYNLMTTIPGLFALGECNFSDHGANRLGSNALLQGLADGYFVISTGISNYLANMAYDKVSTDHTEFKKARNEVAHSINSLIDRKGKRTVGQFHRKLGKILWDKCGISRTVEGLDQAKEEIQQLKQEFQDNVAVGGTSSDLNMTLEHALRVSDFIELAELMVSDAYHRNESCGSHFRKEFQTVEGESLRDDERYAYVAAWEFSGEGSAPILHKEELVFNDVKLSQRSYE